MKDFDKLLSGGGLFCLLTAIVCLVWLWGYNVGMDVGEVRILNMQVHSADAISVNIMDGCTKEIKDVRAELDDFKFDVCSQLGLIK